KYMGDGVLVYFGYPRAHEDDAERAVRAALDIVAAVGRLDTPAIPGTPALGGRSRGQLPARIGIATGLVVVGDLVGAGTAQEQAVVGETPNPRGATAGLGGARLRCDRPGHAPADRRSVPAAGARQARGSRAWPSRSR